VISLGDNANARSVLRKIVITTIIGAISFPFTQLLFSSLAGQVITAAAFGSIVLLIQFLVDFEKRLAKVESRMIDSVAEMRAVVERGFARVNDATQLMAGVETAGLQTVAVTQLMQHAAGISAEAPLLVCAFAQREVDRVSEFLRQLGDEEANYEGEDQDWLLGLTRCAEHSIDAISLPEVDAAGNSFLNFWDSHLGRHYLDLQRDAIRRGVRIRRIFVTERDELDKDPVLRRICRTQAELGIEVRLLYPSAVPRVFRGSLFDFILFDNTLSYEATPAAHVELGETPMILNTRLILRSVRVDERIERYQSIWDSATPWDDAENEVVPLAYVAHESGGQLLEEGRP
jgi:hypothetical protein